MSENKHTPEPLCPAALPFAILDQEMKDLMRFHECAMDDEGYDVPKDRMKRLAEIGLLRRVSANYYEHTTFGLAIINGEFEPADTIRKQRDELNVELAAEKESHASAYADALRQAEHLGRSVARIAELEKQRDELLAELEKMNRAYVNLMENGRDRIIMLGGDCDPVDVMERSDPNLKESRAVIASVKGGAA